MSLTGRLSRRIRLLGLVVLVGLSSLAHGERLRIVSDDWAPYLYQEDAQPKGIDYEVTNEVFKRLGVRCSGSSCLGKDAWPWSNRVWRTG